MVILFMLMTVSPHFVELGLVILRLFFTAFAGKTWIGLQSGKDGVRGAFVADQRNALFPFHAGDDRLRFPGPCRDGNHAPFV
jgi:hypothetical protein